MRPGYKYNMTDVQAALGLHQLPRLDEWIDRRAELWERYDELLAGLPLRDPVRRPSPDTRHARHLYQVLLEPDAPLSRDELLDGLTARNIGTGVHYRAVHLHPYYRDKYGLAPRGLPGREHDLRAHAQPAARARRSPRQTRTTSWRRWRDLLGER